jgi:hypothetical protein
MGEDKRRAGDLPGVEAEAFRQAADETGLARAEFAFKRDDIARPKIPRERGGNAARLLG